MRTGATLVLGLLLGATSASTAAGSGDLAVLEASARLPRDTATGRGRLRLTGDLVTTTETRGFQPATDRVRVVVGPALLLDSEMGPEVSARSRRNGSWRFVQRRLTDRRDRVRFDLLPSSGVFRLKASARTLASLAATGPAGVGVEITLGDEVFTGSLDFDGGGRRWAFHFTTPPRPIPTPNPGPGPGPTPGPAPGPVTWSVLQNGPYSSVTTPQTVVIRSYTDWFNLFPPPPPGLGMPVSAPAVDFNRETLVAVFLGSYPEGGHSVNVNSVTASGGTLHVKYTASHSSGCPVTQAFTTPHEIVKVSGLWSNVTFEGQTVTYSCSQ